MFKSDLPSRPAARVRCFSRLRLQDASDPEASKRENQQNRARSQHDPDTTPETIDGDMLGQVQGGVAVHAAVGKVQHAFAEKAKAEQQEAQAKNQQAGADRPEDDMRRKGV
ncbi:MAG TPA: hypothetical protein VLZ51_04825 [Brevundimonas sp.]|nr:hypothetical protein [Brevundimonas sp.]